MEASVHIINQASVPQGLSSHLTTTAKIKRRSKLQGVTDKTEKKNDPKQSLRTNFDFTKKTRCEAAITNNSVETSVHIINQASVPQGFSSRVTTASEKQKRRSRLQ